ncbi:MAG TPA: condensation domain-containing protein, partial [Thermoanaerobaculia bacterium]|nr:condensation domain-containing protein [Thermoanaerobaculia bacterium]
AELPGCALINGYGPTENTTFTCCHPVREPVPPGGSVPIGRPIANTRVHVLDARFLRVPPGVPGELLTGGDGLARGYLGRPDLTAERFVPSPFATGERLYRTGDRVRLRPDGALEFLGRLDQQVKIRGFRVEPGEVEAALAELPGVASAAVLVEGSGSGKRLVAFVVPTEPEAGPGRLREELRERLPSFMVPSRFAILDALPLSPNGKVDRRALAELLRTLPDDSAGPDFDPPEGPVEELLAGIWSGLLERDRVSRGDDFFALGGHSLLAVRLATRVRGAFGVELPLARIFGRTTLAEMAAEIERGAAGEAPPLTPGPRPAEIPLSFAQERLWFLDRLAPGQAVYNVPVAVRLRGSLDAEALEASLNRLLERHEALRTVFSEGSAGPVQVILPPAPFPLEKIDLTGSAEPEAEARREAAEEARRPFDLTAGPVFRGRLLRIAPEDHLLVLTIHHIAADGWSLGLLFRELGDGSELPPLAVQYADYALWQRGFLTGEVLESRIAWWREALAGAPEVLDLPADRPRPATPSWRGTALPFTLPAPVVTSLRETARRRDATLFMALLAGFSALLSRVSDQQDVVVGTVAANRDRAELEGLIGFFVNALPLRLRLRLDGGPGLSTLLDRGREAALGAFAHGDVPFERLVEALAPRRDRARTPLFQVSLAFQETPARPPRLPGVSAAFEPLHTGTSRFDLNLLLEEDGGGLSGGAEANADLFEATTVERMLGHHAILLGAAAADPERPLEDVPLLS